MKLRLVLAALTSIGALLGSATAGANGLAPTPAANVTRMEPDVSASPGSGPCVRRVKLTYQRENSGLRVDQWYFLIEPCPTDHEEYPSAGNPRAIVVLFPGGDGYANIRNGEPSYVNFVVRERYAFAAVIPAIVAIIDAASDFQSTSPGKPCSTGAYLHGCRYSDDHMIDVANVIQDLRMTVRFPANLPVWLVGTSRGTLSVVAAAYRIRQRFGPNGIVLTSPVISDKDPKEDVLDANLDRIAVPVQILAHRRDECAVSDPGGRPDVNPLGLKALTRRLTGSPRVHAKLVEGGYPAIGNACGPLSPHGFFGLEEKVIKGIAHFVSKR